MYSVYANLRDKRGLTDYAVAKITGVGRSTLSEWGKGKHTPNLENLKRIADFFGVSVEYLIGETEAAISRYVTEEEYMLICAFREAPEYKKEAIKDLLGLLMDVVEEKNVSLDA